MMAKPSWETKGREGGNAEGKRSRKKGDQAKICLEGSRHGTFGESATGSKHGAGKKKRRKFLKKLGGKHKKPSATGGN